MCGPHISVEKMRKLPNLFQNIFIGTIHPVKRRAAQGRTWAACVGAVTVYLDPYTKRPRSLLFRDRFQKDPARKVMKNVRST